MTEPLDQSELVIFTKLLVTNSIQVDTLTQLLIEKGAITDDDFYTKLKQIQMEYRSKDDD